MAGCAFLRLTEMRSFSPVLRTARRPVRWAFQCEVNMPHYKEIRRFRCEGTSGRHYTVIEQSLVVSAPKFASTDNPRTDYLTEDGEIAERLDESTFLLLVAHEVIRITQH